MVTIVTVLLLLLLLALATLHILWALGHYWPAADRADLKDLVLGGPAKVPFPGPFACAIVAGAMAFGAGVVLQLGGLHQWLPAEPAELCARGFLSAFFLRGTLGYGMHRFKFWQDSAKFNHWNRLLYSPLCLAIAAGFAFLLPRMR